MIIGRDHVQTEPPGLNEGEQDFVKDLRRYCLQEKEGVLAGKEVFLLRNLTRGKGVGFFENSGFYPDFILWIKSGESQRIIFVEPHSMFYAPAPERDEKVQLHKKLKDLTESMRQQSGMKNVTLDSYIISQTHFATLAERRDGAWDRQRFAEEHILFRDPDGEYDHLAKIVQGDNV